MDHRLFKITGITGLAVAIVTAVLFLFVDRHISMSARDLGSTLFFHIAQLMSLVGNHTLYNVLLTLGFIIGGILALDRGLTPGVRALLYVCVAVTTVMLVGETLKWFFGRYRPIMLFEHGLYGFSWFASGGDMHSFPSGHTFRIFSAMTALGLVVPRWRVALLTLAVLVGVSRVLVTRHYPSDVLAGAFVGIFGALWIWRIMRLEHFRSARQEDSAR
jgi:membrane-associated phospholipid phosphatase